MPGWGTCVPVARRRRAFQRSPRPRSPSNTSSRPSFGWLHAGRRPTTRGAGRSWRRRSVRATTHDERRGGRRTSGGGRRRGPRRGRPGPPSPRCAGGWRRRCHRGCGTGRLRGAEDRRRLPGAAGRGDHRDGPRHRNAPPRRRRQHPAGSPRAHPRGSSPTVPGVPPLAWYPDASTSRADDADTTPRYKASAAAGRGRRRRDPAPRRRSVAAGRSAASRCGRSRRRRGTRRRGDQPIVPRRPRVGQVEETGVGMPGGGQPAPPRRR